MDEEKQEKKPIYKKWWFWVIIVIVVGVLASAGNSQDGNTVTPAGTTGSNNEQKQTVATQPEDKKDNEKNNQENTQKEEQKDEQNNNSNGDGKVKVGESITKSDVKVTFVSTKDYTGYSQYSAPSKGNKIIRVEFSFQNMSNSDITLSSMECYADGEKCEEHYSADDYKTPTLENLSSGKKLKAVLYFQVPKNAKETVIEYQPSLWSNEKIEFIVK